MKYAIMIAGLFLAVGCAVTRPRYEAPSDLQKNNITGSVSRVESRYLDLDGHEIDDLERPSDFDMVIVSVYNEEGNIVSEETYGAGGTQLSKRDIYIFDETGRKVLSSEYHDLLNNKVTWLRYDYDSKGRLVRYRSVGGEWETEFVNNRRGYPVEMISRGMDTTRTVYKYDGRGRLKKELRGPRLKAVTRYEYHPNGKLKTVSNYSQVEEYDKSGDLIKTVIYIRYRDGDEVETKDGIIEATYRYDERGNWTLRELWTDGKAFGAWVRTLEYRD